MRREERAGDAPSTGESLITRICTCVESLPAGEKRIADYLLQHQSATVGLSQAELAKGCGVSPSTVSRFCKRVGERDYHAFQMSLMQSMSQMHGLTSVHEGAKPISVDDVGGSLKAILSNEVAEITTTVESLSEGDLQRAVELIVNARVVEIGATGRTIPVALDAAYKFERIGIMCPTSEYYEKLLSTALCLRKGDVLLLISRSGWSGVLQQVLHAAKDRGAATILITANRESPLARQADHVFLATSFDHTLDSFAGNSRICEMVIIEVLYALIAARKRDSADYMKAHEGYVLSNVDLP